MLLPVHLFINVVSFIMTKSYFVNCTQLKLYSIYLNK